jgi:hypothetical protein
MLMRLLIAAVVGVNLFLSSTASAIVLYDENHTGFNFQPLQPLGVVDMAEGNFVFEQPTATFPVLNDTFNWHFQTTQDGVIFNNGNVGFTVPGETTFEAVAPLKNSFVSGTSFLAELDGPGAPAANNFFRMYYDNDGINFLGNADIVTGSGFNDGLLILEGYFSAISIEADIATNPGILLATIQITYADPLSWQGLAGNVLTLDGNTFFPPQLLDSASIAGYSVQLGDVRGSVDITLRPIPEASTLILTSLGVLVVAGYRMTRRRSV